MSSWRPSLELITIFSCPILSQVIVTHLNNNGHPQIPSAGAQPSHELQRLDYEYDMVLR